MGTFRSCRFSLFIFLSFLVSTSWANDLYGIFMVVKGDVQVDSSKTGLAKAKVGLKVYPGDKITTKADSRAKVVMSDRNVINLTPDTVISIKRYENDPKTNIRNVELDLVQGKVRNNVEQKYDGDKSKFIIKTPTAVAGVRGTQFLTSFNVRTRETQIVTFRGAVQMASILPNGQVSNQIVMVRKGETSTVKQGQTAPEPPKALPKEEMKKAEKDSQARNSENKKDENKGDKKTALKENSQDKKSEGDQKDSKRNVASEPPSDTMIDKRDVDFDEAKKAKPPIVVEAPPPPPPIPRLPTAIIDPRDQNPAINDTIHNNLNNTKVIIRPVLKQ
ncbi:MAG: FecR domain-containing protein [Bdellovibrionales bacterium]|nr:FecR domain-containing protein [Bdellovibrionales bacterium]